jgi:hypothetical protein
MLMNYNNLTLFTKDFTIKAPHVIILCASIWK